MNSDDKLYAITIPSIVAGVVLLALIGRGCSTSIDQVKKAAIERGCLVLGNGQYVCTEATK